MADTPLRDIDPIAWDMGWLAGYMLFPAAHPDVIWLSGWRVGANFTRNRPITRDDDVRNVITRALAERGMLTERG